MNWIVGIWGLVEVYGRGSCGMGYGVRGVHQWAAMTAPATTREACATNY